MRLAIMMVLLAALSFGQTTPDLSGVFLLAKTRVGNRESQPADFRILAIKQTPEEVTVTATQNLESAVARYRLTGTKKDNARARFKGQKLLVNTTMQFQLPSLGWFIGERVVSAPVEQEWTLSSDRQQLIIRTKSGIGKPCSATYTREPSLEIAEADLAANQKDHKSPKSIPVLTKNEKIQRTYGQGTDLGVAFLHGIRRCVWYDAVLSGDFFKHLERTTNSSRSLFRNNGQPTSAYNGDLVLEIAPHPQICSGEAGEWAASDPPPPDAVQHLRFRVRWHGIAEKDLGEIQSEFLYEPWRETNIAQVFYRMRIPAQDIPLTNELEVQIFAATGEPLACIKGHI